LDIFVELCYGVSTVWSMLNQCLLCCTLYKTHGTRRLYMYSRRIKQRFIRTPLYGGRLGPKVHVNYCHHLASVVCRLSSVVCKLFTFQASSPKPLGRLEPNNLTFVIQMLINVFPRMVFVRTFFLHISREINNIYCFCLIIFVFIY
jgi:hypothetical protein